MTGKEIYNILSVCGLLKIDRKVYNDWVKTEKSLVGFIGVVKMKGEKHLVLNRIKYWCLDRKLPIEVIDDEKSSTHFKIKIIKP